MALRPGLFVEGFLILALRGGLELDLGAERYGQLDDRLGFIEQAALAWCDAELFTTGPEPIGLQDPEGLFQQSDALLTPTHIGTQPLVLALQQRDARRGIHCRVERVRWGFQHRCIIARLITRCSTICLYS